MSEFSGKIPESLDKAIYDFYKGKRGVGTNWHDIADMFNAAFDTNFAESSLRGRYQEYIPEDMENKPGRTLEMNEDGTVKIFDIMALTSDKQKTPEYVMKTQGFDPEEWTMFKFTMGEWGKRDEPLFSVRLELKPRDKSKLTLDDIVRVNKEYQYVHVPMPCIYQDVNNNEGKALEIALPDIHIGSSSSNIVMIKERITKIANYARQTRVDKIYLTFLGDILHVDNTNNTTIKGTQLTVETTAQDMYLEAKDLLNYIVAELAEFEMEVFHVAGNHSEALEFALFDALADSWKANNHITFHVDATLRKAYLYGVTLVGVTHGHMPKKQLFGWLASEFPELWGKAKYREMHYGHSHMEKVDPADGITNRMIPTTSDVDNWEYRQGFQEGQKIIQCFLWDKKAGLAETKRF